MNKQNMKTAFLSFLIACAGAYAAYTTKDEDPRTTEFAKYISDDITELVSKCMTAEEIQQYATDYRKDPAAYELWISHLTDRSKLYNRKLLKEAAAIHKLDSVAGRELAFSEALRRIDELVDTTANPSDEIMLQRLIKAKRDTDVNLALSRAAMKKVASEK